ncbi:MAG: hypothetical protein RSG96_02045, partial [Clostridia bacterium]
ATDLCRRMVTQFGMTDALGTMYLSNDQEVFVGMEFGQSREFSESIATAIDAEIKRLLDSCYQRACKLIEENHEKLTAVAEALLQRETLSRTEFEAVMNGEELPPLTETERLKPIPVAADPAPAQSSANPASTASFATEEENSPFMEPERKL